MNITFAQKIGLISSSVGLVVGGSFLYSQAISPSEREREPLAVEESQPSILGDERSVGQIVPMEEQIQERKDRYNIKSSYKSLSSQEQRETMDSLETLSEEYNIPITEVSNFPGGVFPFEESLNYVLSNIERVEIPSEVFGGQPTIVYRYNPLMDDPDAEYSDTDLFKFSLEDEVTTLIEREIEGLDMSNLEEAMVEIVTILIDNLGSSEFPFEQIINNPNLRNLILAEIGLGGTIGSGLPPITLEMLGLDTMEFLDEIDPELLEAIAFLAEIYPEILGFTRDPEAALTSLLLEYLPPGVSIQEIIEGLTPEQILERLKNEVFGQILSAFIVQIPIFEFAPCGEKLLSNSPRRYSPAIPMCSLCKRYCATKTFGFFGGSITYHSYLFGRGRCGCDPAPGAVGLPF